MRTGTVRRDRGVRGRRVRREGRLLGVRQDDGVRSGVRHRAEVVGPDRSVRRPQHPGPTAQQGPDDLPVRERGLREVAHVRMPQGGEVRVRPGQCHDVVVTAQRREVLVPRGEVGVGLLCGLAGRCGLLVRAVLRLARTVGGPAGGLDVAARAGHIRVSGFARGRRGTGVVRRAVVPGRPLDGLHVRLRGDVQGGTHGGEQAGIHGEDGIRQLPRTRGDPVEGPREVAGGVRIRRLLQQVGIDQGGSAVRHRIERDGDDGRDLRRIDPGVRVPDGESRCGRPHGAGVRRAPGVAVHTVVLRAGIGGGAVQGHAQAVGTPRADSGTAGAEHVRGDREAELRLFAGRDGRRQVRHPQAGAVVLGTSRAVSGRVRRLVVGTRQQEGRSLPVDPPAHVVAHRHPVRRPDDGHTGRGEIVRSRIDHPTGHGESAVLVQPRGHLVEHDVG